MIFSIDMLCKYICCKLCWKRLGFSGNSRIFQEFLLLKPFGSKFQLRSILMTWVFPTSDLMYQFALYNNYFVGMLLAFSLLLVLGILRYKLSYNKNHDNLKWKLYIYLKNFFAIYWEISEESMNYVFYLLQL